MDIISFIEDNFYYDLLQVFYVYIVGLSPSFKELVTFLIITLSNLLYTLM